MLVKMLVSRAGPGGASAGDEIEVSTDEAQRMIERGQCQPVRTKRPERAVARKKAEKASR